MSALSFSRLLILRRSSIARGERLCRAHPIKLHLGLARLPPMRRDIHGRLPSIPMGVRYRRVGCLLRVRSLRRVLSIPTKIKTNKNLKIRVLTVMNSFLRALLLRIFRFLVVLLIIVFVFLSLS